MAKAGQSPEEKVLRFIRENRLLKKGEKLVVAVSGGPDSVCLLHILYKLQKGLGVSLHVAHLNHRLRGADADADAEYVARLAQKLKIPATVEARDVKAYRAQHRLSLEEAAREAPQVREREQEQAWLSCRKLLQRARPVELRRAHLP